MTATRFPLFLSVGGDPADVADVLGRPLLSPTLAELCSSVSAALEDDGAWEASLAEASAAGRLRADPGDEREYLARFLVWLLADPVEGVARLCAAGSRERGAVEVVAALWAERAASDDPRWVADYAAYAAYAVHAACTAARAAADAALRAQARRLSEILLLPAGSP